MRVPAHVLSDTGRHLSDAARRRLEGMVVWLGNEEPERVYAAEVEAGPQHFVVPPAEVRRLTEFCSANRVRILAQVHSHPGANTRHSSVDDRDALPHRLGAISIVLPHYGRYGFAARGWRVYELAESGWTEVPTTVLEFGAPT